IDNYPPCLSRRRPGEPPPTLFEYLPSNALLVVDESHVTVPQIGGMFKGDYARKSTLTEYGLPSSPPAAHRPLKFEEWDEMRPEAVFVSATPSQWEMARAQ